LTVTPEIGLTITGDVVDVKSIQSFVAKATLAFNGTDNMIASALVKLIYLLASPSTKVYEASATEVIGEAKFAFNASAVSTYAVVATAVVLFEAVCG
jgi:hypothetical protein